MNKEKRFQFSAKCDFCEYAWEANTDMKYYVTCPDCKKSVYIRHITQELQNK